jgi:hypothetical protein
MKIELTVQEANSLLMLIDIAVKSAGLQVAPAAIAMMQKIQQAEAESAKTSEA